MYLEKCSWCAQISLDEFVQESFAATLPLLALRATSNKLLPSVLQHIYLFVNTLQSTPQRKP